MKRHEALEIICKTIDKNDLVISTTGNISRELFIIRDSPQNFYMLGSMGLASSIGLGLAICFPKKRIIVIEGDGSILMNMGSMATVGRYTPNNLIHIVLDNEAYESCGDQPSVAKTANLDKIARVVGYRIVQKVDSEEKLKGTLESIKSSHHGAVFILVKVEKGRISNWIPRVQHTLEEIKTRFEEFIKNNFQE